MKNIFKLLSFLIVISFFSCSKTEINELNPIEKSTELSAPSNLVLVSKKFLFDASQGETAGNADWVIDQDNNNPQRFPTPLQSAVTSTTAGTYWTGGISSFGIALVKKGHLVETLPSNGSITYNVTTNPQDLKNYDVFVVDEPNIRFTTTEKRAILNFVFNGGGLFTDPSIPTSTTSLDKIEEADIIEKLTQIPDNIKNNPKFEK